MADFINENNARPTRLLLRSDTISNWLSSSSTPLMYGEVGVGYDENGTGVIAKIGSIKDEQGQRWSDAPQLNATVDESGLNLEEVGRVYASVVVDNNNNPVSSFTKEFFYPACSNDIKYLYGNLNELPYSLRCGTEGTPPDSTIYNYRCIIAPAKNYIVPKYLSGWRTTLSVNTSDEIPSIFEAPIGFVHPEFNNVLPCDPEGVLHVLPIQPIQTAISVLSWVENVEVWTMPISPIGNETSLGNYAMQFLGTVSGWFPFPYRQFICDNTGIEEPTEGNTAPQIQCQITLTPSSDSDVDTDNTTTDIAGSAGTGQFNVSSIDINFTCASYPEYCSNNGICGTCMSWAAQVIEGGDWFRLTNIERDTVNCEPSTGTIFYEYDENSEFNAQERTAVVRVFTTTSVGSEIPREPTYSDFTFTQSQPKCEIKNVFPIGISLNSSAHTETFTVRTQSQTCTWSASIEGSAPWITILNPTGGYNGDNDDFGVSIGSNAGTGEDTEPRIAYINVTDTSITGTGNVLQVRIYQQGNNCEIQTIDPEIQNSIPADTSSTPDYSFDILFNTEDEVCTWETVILNVSGNFIENWITVTQNATGSGSETISYSVNSNPSIAERSATINVLNKDILVSQNATACFIEKLEDPDTLLAFSPNITGCITTRYFTVDPYACTSKNGCVDEENCSWYVDLTTIQNNYPWITITGVGDSLDNLGANNSVITGFGIVEYQVSEFSGLDGLCTTNSRVGEIRVVPQTNTSEFSIFTITQSCADICACDSKAEGCGGENPCVPKPEGCSVFGPDPNNPTVCICLCDDGTPPMCDEENNCVCSDDPPSCFNDGGIDPSNPGGNPPTSGTGQNPNFPCGISTWEKLYTIPEQVGYVVIFESNIGIIEGDFGVIEINTLKISNTFVKINGYLNPGVSVVWNNTTGLWEPKYVPNFYSEELTQNGFVYYNITTNKWEITNVIDGGSA